MYKKHKLSNLALLKKAKLWLVLHDVNILYGAAMNCEGKCPNEDMDNSLNRCKIPWSKRLATNQKMDKVGYEGDYGGKTLYYCIEWVKYV
jgi:hypothetical protein